MLTLKEHLRDSATQADLPVRMGFSTGDLEIWHKPTRSEDLKPTAEGGRAEECQNDWVWLSFGRVRLWDKQSAHKEWVRRQFRNPCFTGLICSGYLQAGTYQLILVCRIEPEIAVVSFGCPGISIYVGSLRPRFHAYFHGFSH